MSDQLPPPPGKLHGPGNVSKVPSMFKRAAGFLSGHEAKAAPSTGFESTTANMLDEDTLRFFVVGMTSGNPAIQRYLVDHYTLPDVEFVHPAGATRGQENFYHVYRAATTSLDYHLVFRDIIAGRGKACVWVDLRVKPRQVPFLGRRTLPCLVILHFKQDPADGRTKLALQHDHFSFYGLYWQGGAAAQQFAEAFIRPLLGRMLVASGRWAEFRRVKWQQVQHAVGWQSATRADESDGDAALGLSGGDADGVFVSPGRLDKFIRQATSEISLSKVEEDDTDFLAAWGVLGWPLQAARAAVGVCSASFIMFIASVLQFLLPLA